MNIIVKMPYIAIWFFFFEIVFYFFWRVLDWECEISLNKYQSLLFIVIWTQMAADVKHIHSRLSYIKRWNCIICWTCPFEQIFRLHPWIYLIAIDSIFQQFSINLCIFFLKTHFFVLCRDLLLLVMFHYRLTIKNKRSDEFETIGKPIDLIVIFGTRGTSSLILLALVVLN